MFERAEMAGEYLALRLEARSRSDPSVLAFRHTGSVVGQRQPDADVEALVFDRDDPDGRAVERMSTAAAEDDGYRVQLLDLAALHGGLCEKAVSALYAIEVRSLGRYEAEARHLLDQRQVTETRQRDAGEAGDGSTLTGCEARPPPGPLARPGRRIDRTALEE